MKHDLSDTTWNALIEGLLLNKYHLLLGAGASLDVLDKKNKCLPSGSQLAEELVKTFRLSVSDSEKFDLQRIFRAAGRKTSAAGETLDTWLVDRFSNTKPPAWYSQMETATWRTIWTLNIDDAVSQSMGKRCKPFHFSDDSGHVSDGETPVVHLHGYAPQPEKGFVFSISDYRNHVSSPKAWSLRFEETLSDHPFLIIGAALHHEFDLVSALDGRARSASRQYPSIAVRPNPTEMDREDFQAWNIEIFDGTAEEFFNSIRNALSEKRKLLLPQNASSNHTSPALVRFLEQWRPIASGRRPKWHDYLSGEEPEFSDAKAGNIIKRDIQDTIVETITSGKPTLLSGPPFSGKSSVAVRTCAELVNSGWSVFEYADDNAPNVSAILVRMREFPNTVLYIEDASDYARNLFDLFNQAEEAGIPIRMLAVDRNGPADRLIKLDRFVERPIPSKLSNKEIQSLVTLISQKKSLAKPWDHFNLPRDIEKFRQKGLVTMAAIISNLVFEEAFEPRVKGNYRRIQDEALQSTAVFGAVGSQAAGGIPVGVAARALGISGRYLEQKLESDTMAHSMIRIRNGKIRLKHRLFSDILTSKVLEHREMYGIISQLCITLAPDAGIDAIRNNTWAHRMVSHILDHDRLSELIGRESLDDFYTTVEGGYSWNSRFWEQRALAASQDRAHYVAVRYATKAVAINPDGYSLNTLATVMYRRLWEEGLEREASDVNFDYWEATKEVKKAKSKSRPDSEHPFITFFHNAERYGKWRLDAGCDLPFALRREWNEWWEVAISGKAFLGEKGEKRLKDYQARWLALASL